MTGCYSLIRLRNLQCLHYHAFVLFRILPRVREHDVYKRNISHRMPSPNLFSPVFPQGPRPYRSEFGSVRPRISSFNSMDQPHVHFSYANNQYFGPSYPPQHPLPNSLPHVPPNGMNGHRPMPTNDVRFRCPPPRMGLHMQPNDPNHPRFTRFPPRFDMPEMSNAPPRLYNAGLQSKDEDMVNSELDKMAVMLASSKNTSFDGSTTSTNTDVETQSPIKDANPTIPINSDEAICTPKVSHILNYCFRHLRFNFCDSGKHLLSCNYLYQTVSISISLHMFCFSAHRMSLLLIIRKVINSWLLRIHLIYIKFQHPRIPSLGV